MLEVFSNSTELGLGTVFVLEDEVVELPDPDVLDVEPVDWVGVCELVPDDCVVVVPVVEVEEDEPELVGDEVVVDVLVLEPGVVAGAELPVTVVGAG